MCSSNYSRRVSILMLWGVLFSTPIASGGLSESPVTELSATAALLGAAPLSQASSLDVSLSGYVPGRIIVKLRPALFPVVPIGRSRDAIAAAEASRLGHQAKLAFQEIIERYEVRFTRALFFIPTPT